jgi:choline dehydrogenase
MGHVRDNARYDTIIVGAGSAGAILATRLTEDAGRTVCLIEAGPDYTAVDQLPDRVRRMQSTSRMFGAKPIRSHEWGYSARATDEQLDMPVPRGRVIGGSSSINGTVLLRALRADLDNWAAMGNSGWDYASCAPYFRKLETDRDFPDALHGVDGPIPVSRAARADWVPVSKAFHAACVEMGHADCPDMNLPDARGVGPIPTNFADGTRYSTAVGYLMPSRPRANLTVLADTLATRIRFDGHRASGVEIVRAGQVSVLESEQVIVAAGAIGSPRLLMLSGIGPADRLHGLGIEPLVDLPGVGQHMRDHPYAVTLWNWQEGLSMPEPPTGLGWQIQLRTTAPGSPRRDDAWITMLTRSGMLGSRSGFAMPASLMYAASQGELTLTSADPTAPPKLDFRYFSDPTDLDHICAIVRLAVEIGSHAAFDAVRHSLAEPGVEVLESQSTLEEWVKRTVNTGHHVSCTCRMGSPADPTSVVDTGGRVHGLEGLRVIDASILPDCPSVNLNATVMMVAEKLADQLRLA